MICRLFSAVIIALACCWSSTAESVTTGSTPTAVEAAPQGQAANSEMREIFAADQAIRLEVEKRGGWIAVKDDKAFLQMWENADLRRLNRTRELLNTNSLKAGVDFYHAAFIFQHSDKPEDFLKAHHLAVIAISKGYDARWISAATLDRYLQATGKQQIYGTQYRANETGEYVRQPVNAGIVSDPERVQLNVPALDSAD